MRGRIRVNYEMAWIELKECIEKKEIVVDRDMIHTSDLLMTMDDIEADNRDD